MATVVYLAAVLAVAQPEIRLSETGFTRVFAQNYRRKPRGGPDKVPPECCYRLSFCCDRDGCRKRSTPPSVRFLGRNVYLGAVVVLVAAMCQGPTPRRLRELPDLFGVDRQTIERWRVFWEGQFSQSPFWKVARGRLAPITVTGGLESEVF